MFPRRLQSPTLPGGFSLRPHSRCVSSEAVALIFLSLFVASLLNAFVAYGFSGSVSIGSEKPMVERQR